MSHSKSVCKTLGGYLTEFRVQLASAVGSNVVSVCHASGDVSEVVRGERGGDSCGASRE